MIRRVRAWFRRRLEHAPRDWVLALAAAEGLVAFCANLQDRRASLLESGVGLAVAVGFAVTAPASGVLLMLFHGRLLYRTGRWLGGRAEPHEIHAACAWSQLPLVVVACPLTLELPLRVAAAERGDVPGWMRAALAACEAIGEPVAMAAGVAGLVGAALYVALLAEAQRFSTWRAVANQVLAVAGLLAVVAVAAGIVAAVAPGLHGLVLVPVALGALAAAAVVGDLAAALAERLRAPARVA